MIPGTKIQTQALLQEASSLLIVTALCGAGAALTTTADAAVISTPGVSPSTPIAIPLNIDGVYVNVVTGVANGTFGLVPGWDLNPFNASALSFFNPTVPAGSVYARFPGGPATPGNLPGGFVVDLATTWSSGTANFTVVPGQWFFNSGNYFGFRFQNEGTGQVHFGYGKIEVGATAIDPVRRITELYYEDQPGVGIAIGAVPAPEPTGALLAAGAAGLMALRRRRQAA